ncbi:Crp/Fnr family transcriptional regulator [Euhalothece natronophila Z-M001]|uniref:Crp/Fnr family transcriptional regulator n=1 Tax=Euhalothece natronophila Z-M001 TaxID=522448 RepID=A0A5B8NPS2_9CHRO|nr:Crp/Fnr family transcriptional regulator [Euhalothece natronophila]QDZ41302.1 Crp/Fnr family transcriptional regulator [Euhalothece natronophila Z-M001]
MLATVKQLQQLWILNSLSEENLEELQPHAKIRQFQKDEMVMIEGDHLPACLFALLEGQLQIQKTADTGKETVVRVIRPGQIFAAPAMFGNQIAPATVIAKAPVVVVMLDKGAILDAIGKNPEIALRILETFNQRLQHLHETVHGLISERAIARLARLILYHGKEYGTMQKAEGEVIQVKLSYYQMARMIGITYEECIRLIKKMSEAITYRRGGTLIIHNWQSLESFAQEED